MINYLWKIVHISSKICKSKVVIDNEKYHGDDKSWRGDANVWERFENVEMSGLSQHSADVHGEGKVLEQQKSYVNGACYLWNWITNIYTFPSGNKKKHIANAFLLGYFERNEFVVLNQFKADFPLILGSGIVWILIDECRHVPYLSGEYFG